MTTIPGWWVWVGGWVCGCGVCGWMDSQGLKIKLISAQHNKTSSELG